MRATDKQLLAAQILVATKQEDLEWGWDVLSKIYHFGTKDIPYASSPKNIKEWAQQYAQHCKEAIGKVTPVMSSLDEDTAIFLPPPVVDPDRSDLIRNLIERKTCRQFSGSAVNLSILSTTLYYSLGHLKEREEDEGLVFEEYSKRRCAPSGGGLNCIEGYVYCSRVTALIDGLYYYDPKRHALFLQSDISDDILGDLLCGQHFANDLPFGLFLTGRLDKLWWKYEHSRAYRMALVEAGHVSQCFQLIATALGLNTWLTGALNESPIERLMRNKHKHEHALFFVGAGYSNGEIIPEELKSILLEN